MPIKTIVESELNTLVQLANSLNSVAGELQRARTGVGVAVTRLEACERSVATLQESMLAHLGAVRKALREEEEQ